MSELLADLAPYLIVGSICLLVGAALGNYTAHADNDERARRGRPE